MNLSDAQIRRARRVYQGLVQRCYNPNNPNYCFYGSKNIKVEFEYSKQWVEWYYQQQQCSLCDRKMENFGSSNRRRCINRKETTKGYSYTNCRIICKSCNSRKAAAVTNNRQRQRRQKGLINRFEIKSKRSYTQHDESEILNLIKQGATVPQIHAKFKDRTYYSIRDKVKLLKMRNL